MTARVNIVIASLWFLLTSTALALPPTEPNVFGPRILHVQAAEQRAEQGILTPLPIRLKLTSGLAARRVLVSYKLHGLNEFSTVELLPFGDEYRGYIPCHEVSTVTGEVLYYIRVHDASGAVVAYSGSRHQPYRVRIIHESERPDLAHSPARCPDPADCPPGMLGCPSERVARTPCHKDADCEGSTECGWDGFCEPAGRRKNALSVALERGAGVVATAGACALSSQENEGYACFRKTDGENYLGAPLYTNEPLALATQAPTRVMLGYERLVYYDTSVGLRVGYTLLGRGRALPGVGDPFPLSAEVRVAHWLSPAPYTASGLKAFLLVVGGAGQFDLGFDVAVREDTEHYTGQPNNDLEQSLKSWKRVGDAYLGVGAGLAYPLTSSYWLRGELLLAEAFPYNALLLLPSLGIELRF